MAFEILKARTTILTEGIDFFRIRSNSPANGISLKRRPCGLFNGQFKAVNLIDRIRDWFSKSNQKYDYYGTRLKAGTYRVVLEMKAKDGTPHYLAAEFDVE